MTPPTAKTSPGRFALAIHGGAGTLRHGEMNAERAVQYHAGLRRALEAGRDVLVANGSALDAVTAAVVALEDDPPVQCRPGRGVHRGWDAGDGCGGDGRARAPGRRRRRGLRAAKNVAG